MYPSLLLVCLLALALELVEGITEKAITVHRAKYEGACGVNSGELSHDVEPEKYRVALDLTNLRDSTFGGNVEIDVKVHSKLPTNKIYLHAVEQMEFQDIWFEGKSSSKKYWILGDWDQERKVIREICLNTQLQVLVVTLAEYLRPKASGKLGISYTSRYGKTGIVRRKVMLENKEHKEVTFKGLFFARRVFPCFDEPSFPAIFQLEVTHSDKLNPLSGTVYNDRDPRNGQLTKYGYKVTVFEPTRNITDNLALLLLSDE